MTYTLDECDSNIKEYWALSVREDDPGQKIIYRDYVNYWLDIRLSLTSGKEVIDEGTALAGQSA